MADSHPTSSSPIRLQAGRDDERAVVVHPHDNDLFVRTGRQVIEACQLRISLEVWMQEVEGMIDRVGEWARQHEDAVERVYAVPRGSRLIFFVVPRGTRFHFDLADEMATLNIDLVKSFNVGTVELRQIPRGEVERFIGEQATEVTDGGFGQPHQAVET